MWLICFDVDPLVSGMNTLRTLHLPESYWRRFCPRCCHSEWSRCWPRHLFSWQQSWAANASVGCSPGWRSAEETKSKHACFSLSLFALGSVSPCSGCSTMTRKQEAALLTKQIWNTLAILTEPWTTFVLTTSLSPCRTCGWAVEAPQGKWSAAGPSCRLTVDGCRPGRSRSVLRGSTPPTSEKHTKIVLFVIALLIKHLSEQQHKHHTHGKGSGSSRQDHPLNIVVQWIGNFLAKDKIPH